MENTMPEDFDNIEVPSLPQETMELSAELSQGSFNLEDEVMAMLDEEIPDLGEVQLSAEFKLDEMETGDLDLSQENLEVNKELPQPRKAVDENEEDWSEEFLFGPEEPATTGQGVAGQPSEPKAQEEATDTAAFEREVRREMEEGAFEAKTSRYMRDQRGDLLYKWKADYASRGGGGRAQCKDQDCLERHEQGGIRTIEKGCLRIGRRVLMDGHGENGHIQLMWYHARCMFNTFLRAKKSTRVIETEFDIEGFEDLTLEDRDMLRRLIDGNEAQALKNVRFRSFDAQVPTRTPDKRGITGAGGPGDIGPESSSKRRKQEDVRLIKKGDRVWTHFRCLPKEGPPGAMPPGGAVFSVKSEKPELAMVSEDIDSGTLVVQFESQEHEKDRLTLYTGKRGRKIKGWLRYPRLFEGKKQRVPCEWIKWNRPPPSLCACVKQEWGHECHIRSGGITCGRSASNTVWGVAG